MLLFLGQKGRLSGIDVFISGSSILIATSHLYVGVVCVCEREGGRLMKLKERLWGWVFTFPHSPLANLRHTTTSEATWLIMDFMETDSLKVFPYVCSQYIPASSKWEYKLAHSLEMASGCDRIVIWPQWLSGWPFPKDTGPCSLASVLVQIQFQRGSSFLFLESF